MPPDSVAKWVVIRAKCYYLRVQLSGNSAEVLQVLEVHAGMVVIIIGHMELEKMINS